MVIYHPGTPLEAVTLRRDMADTAVYLAGGTDNLRLGSDAAGKDLIDLSALGMDDIYEKDGRVYIGARCTLNELIESELVPEFLKDAARLCSSFVRRNSATVGGNLGLRRQDSYLAAAFTAAEAVLLTQTPHGKQEKPVGEYLQSRCKRLIEYITVEKDRTGWVRRFGNTSASHAALIAAHSGGVYALSIHGSDFTYGKTADIVKDMTFTDDLTGSADYKKYLASIVFTLEGR